MYLLESKVIFGTSNGKIIHINLGNLAIIRSDIQHFFRFLKMRHFSFDAAFNLRGKWNYQIHAAE